MGSPYINRFLQPDSIIPDQTNPQSWNRFAYVENDPINYADASGNFKCKNSSTTFEGDCQAVIEAYLTLLQEQGGEEGQALVEAFRDGDTATHCYRGGKCVEVKDQITIIVRDSLGGARARYTENILGTKNYFVSAEMMNASGVLQLVHAGAFGHEITHQTQGYAQLETVLAELKAWNVQWQLYENMSISTLDYYDVNTAREIAPYMYESEDEIMESRWATQGYGGLPFTNSSTPEWHPYYPPSSPRHTPI